MAMSAVLQIVSSGDHACDNMYSIVLMECCACKLSSAVTVPKNFLYL